MLLMNVLRYVFNLRILMNNNYELITLLGML